MSRAPLYRSRPIRWRRRAWGRTHSYVVSEGCSPYNELVFHPNHHIHDLAMWHLKLEAKYQRWPWFRSPPSRPFGIEFIEVGPLERAIGWLLAGIVLLRAVAK